MNSDFAPKLAKVLTEYCRPIQKGDYVLIRAAPVAEPLIEALYEAVLKRGGNPQIVVDLANIDEIFIQNADEAQMAWINPSSVTALEQADVLFAIIADYNTHKYGMVDPERLTLFRKGQQPLSELYLGRCRTDDLRWNITAWPTQAAAQEANMGYLAYCEFIYNACGLHHDDPVAYWKSFRDRQDELTAWLKGKSRVEVRGPGIEMAFGIEGRTWINSHGIRNFPDGEIFTCPIEDSVNGYVEFNYPSVHGGREVDGVRLTFKDGVVVEASAEKGQDFLLNRLDLDAGARRLGEFAIGTNQGIQRFTRSTLFDEKIGGTIHMALGENPGPTGGVNTSMIHWDMVHNMRDGGEIFVDGELFYLGGRFMIESE